MLEYLIFLVLYFMYFHSKEINHIISLGCDVKALSFNDALPRIDVLRACREAERAEALLSTHNLLLIK